MRQFVIGFLCVAACGGVDQAPHGSGSGSGSGSAITGPTDMLEIVTGWIARVAGDATSPDNLHFDHANLEDAMVLRSNGELDVKTAIRVGSSGAITESWWELGADSASTPAGIDFHTGTTPTDFDARLARDVGADGDFGLDNAGNGNLLLSTQHVPRLAISAAGKVGIGTTSTDYQLEVVGPVRFDGIHPFLKGGNNGTATCTTFCAGANWPGGVGACLGGKNVDTGFYDYGCNTTLGALGNIVCLCAAF